jgi:hypothetical protein
MISFPVILLRLAVALLLGAVIGFEREQKESEALGIICRIPSAETLAKVISEMRALPEISAIHANLHSTNNGYSTWESSIT